MASVMGHSPPKPSNSRSPPGPRCAAGPEDSADAEPDHRRPARGGASGPDRPGGGAGAGHHHPGPVLTQGPVRGRLLPAMPGRGPTAGRGQGGCEKSSPTARSSRPRRSRRRRATSPPPPTNSLSRPRAAPRTPPSTRRSTLTSRPWTSGAPPNRRAATRGSWSSGAPPTWVALCRPKRRARDSPMAASVKAAMIACRLLAPGAPAGARPVSSMVFPSFPPFVAVRGRGTAAGRPRPAAARAGAGRPRPPA